jgi:hypothetical protein
MSNKDSQLSHREFVFWKEREVERDNLGLVQTWNSCWEFLIWKEREKELGYVSLGKVRFIQVR